MDQETKAKFILALHHRSLKAFDGGGVISAGNSNPLSGVSGALTAQNSFQANNPYDTQEQNLANQYQQQAQGQGPNPALEQLNQTTQQNAGQAASLAASNRGLNAGQAARVATEAQVNANQTAGGQAATLAAQQQIAAEGQEGTVLNNAATQNLGAEGINAQVAQNNANSVNQTQGGILGGIASGVTSLFHAKGGEIEPLNLAGGGFVPGSISTPYAPNLSNAAATSGSKFPMSGAGKYLNSTASSATPANNFGASTFFQGSAPPSSSPVAGASPSLFAKGGKVQPMAPAKLMKSGGKVNAQNKKEKPVKEGDSLKNDKIPAMLSAGEIVIPRHITQHPNAPQLAAQFVQAVLNKKKMGKTL